MSDTKTCFTPTKLTRWLCHFVVATFTCGLAQGQTAQHLVGSWILDSEATEQYLIAHPPGVLDESFVWAAGSSCFSVVTLGSDWADVGGYRDPVKPRLRMRQSEDGKVSFRGEVQPGKELTLKTTSVDSGLLIDFGLASTPLVWKRATSEVISKGLGEIQLNKCFEVMDRTYKRFTVKTP